MLRRNNLLAFAAMAAAALSLQAADGATNLRVASVDVLPHDDMLTVTLDIDPGNINPGRDREVTFAPVIRAIDSPDSLELPVFKVCGRNRYYTHLRNDDLADGDVIMEAGKKAPGVYTVTVPWQAWMGRSQVVMREDVAHCCDAPAPYATTPVAEIDLSPRAYEAPVDFVALTGDSTVTRSLEGSARITFVLDKTYFHPTHLDNRREFGKITNTINVVKDDRDAIITEVRIKGFASPEGRYAHNVELAMGRTETLKQKVLEQIDLPSDMIITTYEPEDWEGLRRWLMENHDSKDVPNAAAILEIANRQDLDPDQRDNLIRSTYKKDYKFLLDSVYPWLRHSDYVVKYNIRTYTDVNELKRIYDLDSTMLRPVDFQRIADSYPRFSPKWEEVYLTAATVYDKDPMAALNAANIMLRRGDYRQAAAYLDRAGQSAEAYYTRANLAARTADLAAAAAYLQQAANLGYAPAAELLPAIEALRDTPQVEYLLPAELYTHP